MKLVTCPKCQSQFDVASMQAGSTFVCGKCRNVLQVPAAPPVMTPIGQAAPPPAPVVQAHQVRHAQSAPPPTVALTPEEMKKALASVKQHSPAARTSGTGPKLPAAMEKRRQSTNSGRAAGAPVVPQVASSAPRQGPAPPNTVVLTPEEMRKAIAASKTGVAPGDDAAAEAAPAAAPKPAARPAARTGAARGASRRSGSAAAAVPIVEAEPEEGDEDVPMAAPMKKKPVALYAGIGVVALIAVVAVAMSGGDKKPDEKKSEVAAPKPENLDEHQQFAAMPAGDADMFIAGKLRDAGNDPVKLERVFLWMKDPKVADNPKAKEAAKRAADMALLADPNASWVRTARSEKPVLELLTKTKASSPCAFSQPTADEAAIEAALAKYGKEPWVSEKVYSELEQVCKTVLVREESLKNNPRLPIALKKHEWAEKSPLFTGLKWLPAKFDDPYLISQQYEEFKDDADKHKNAERRTKAQWVADTDAIVFKETYHHWLELFGERFKFPKLEGTNRVLHAVITWNRDSFADLYRRNNPGAEIAGTIRAFYSPHEQRIFHYLGEEAMREQDEIPTEDDRIQKFAYKVAAHEETHQLQHEYTAIYQGHPLVDGSENVLPRRLMWFEEGLAEFMGSIEVDRASKANLAKATFYHNRLQIDRLAPIRGYGRGDGMRDSAKLWTIDQLLKPNHNGELQKMGETLNPGHRDEMGILFYARAWALTHFLWFYDNGKYREQFMTYLESVLKDQQSAAGFAKIMGKKGGEWGDVASEFEWYWNELLKRKMPSGDTEKDQKIHVDTDPPQGKWVKEEEEDDEGK